MTTTEMTTTGVMTLQAGSTYHEVLVADEDVLESSRWRPRLTVLGRDSKYIGRSFFSFVCHIVFKEDRFNQSLHLMFYVSAHNNTHNTADSRWLASASDDKTMRLWDAATGKCERMLKGHSDSV